MGYQATFLARKRYAASDINSISTSLSLSPSSFTDETAYGVSDLNSITSSLVTAGVSSGCDVIKIDDTKLKVNTGTLFFSNGCRIDIDSDGVFLQYDSGEKYIYAFYDSAESGVSINIADSLPESGDFVSLAKYDGTDITDLRKFARSKVVFPTEAMSYKKTFHVPQRTDYSTSDPIVEMEINISSEGVSWIFIENLTNSTNCNPGLIEFGVDELDFYVLNTESPYKHKAENNGMVTLAINGSGYHYPYTTYLKFVENKDGILKFNVIRNESAYVEINFNMYVFGGGETK